MVQDKCQEEKDEKKNIERSTQNPNLTFDASIYPDRLYNICLLQYNDLNVYVYINSL